MEPVEPILAWNLGPDYPRWTETLRDRTRILIRPITRQDAAAERAFIEALSPQSRGFRFRRQVAHPGRELIARLTDIDYRQEVAVAAVATEDAGEKFLGVSRYSESRDGTSCECAVAVLDAWQHKGLGTALMRHLIQVARARGIQHMYSIDKVENREMANLAHSLGFSRRNDPEDGSQIIHELRLSCCPVA